ncbi:IQ and ubiquitin-like domain-containing protein [Phyllopteryx taeniolatus]|uniref:IQ and ubiquitin-like domain-containing protein n=1 Tax=Phyllopteryx taeniolatus TaxID=161469 RepID=UPI002AD538F0|nr:IQ and ubiquitin-like domain-containing protein [Phyllopteryx taeniolatus]
MSEQEHEATIPPGSEENQEEPGTTENQGEASDEEHKDHEALPGSEDHGEPGNEDQTSPGVSTSEDQGETGNEEETLLGVDNTEENQGEPGNEDETLLRRKTSEDQGEPGNEEEQDNESLPGVSTSDDQAEPGNEDETLSEVNTSVDQGEPGTGEDQEDETLPGVSTSDDQAEPGNEDETLSEVNTSVDQGEPGTGEDQEDETLPGVKTSEGQPGGEDEQGSCSRPGQAARDQQSLSELGVQPHGTATVEMTSSEPDTHPLRTHADSEREDMQNVINVSLLTDDGAPQDAPGESEHPHLKKPFLGGYRHKLTGAEYHHAAAQTPRRARPGRGVDIVSRDTQTAEQVLQTQQCASSVTTQMTSVGCYISNLKDKLLSPGRYVTADEYHDARLNAVIRLQAHTRRWLSCRAVERLRRERDRRLAWIDLQERRRHEERTEQLRDSHDRWMQPRKKDDLNLLYNALEKWRSDKEHQINATLRGAERKAALFSLLEQETQYIATIGRHGIAIRSDNYNKAVRKFLDKSSTPHQWRAADGRLIEMDTPDTIRARQLGDLYDCVAMAPVSREQRLDILLCLAQIVAVHPCQLTRDIVELINREADLMRRQVKAANLEGLRKRLSTLFLQFIRTPGFNPEVAKHLKVPQSTSQLRSDVFLCHGCQRYLGSAHFRSSTRAHLGRRCLDCTRLKNIAGSRDDFSCYKNILKRLRDGELLLNKDNTIPFMLQVEDIQYLVEVVWGARSALSGSGDLFGLVLVRWERRKDWSPWNCVLLSKDETDAHLQVEDLLKVYDLPVIRSIEHKHLLARRHYNQIPAMVSVAKRGTRGK